MTKLIVHMGLHRTATTTLQTSLRELGQQADGVAFILREHMLENTALDMRRWHASGPVSWLQHIASAPEKAFAKAAVNIGASRVVVSEENLIGTMPGLGGARIYPAFNTFVQRLIKLDVFLKVQPRLVVRRQDGFLESVYAFRVARGLTDDFPTFLSKLKLDELDWNRLATPLEEFGDRTQIAVLEEWRESERLVENALAFVGVYAGGLVKGRGNRSLSNDSTGLILAMNRAGVMGDIAERRQSLFPKLAILEKAGEEVSGVLDQILISSSQKAEIKQHLSSDLQIAFSDRERLLFISKFAKANAQFLNRSEVLADTSVWF